MEIFYISCMNDLPYMKNVSRCSAISSQNIYPSIENHDCDDDGFIEVRSREDENSLPYVTNAAECPAIWCQNNTMSIYKERLQYCAWVSNRKGGKTDRKDMQNLSTTALMRMSSPSIRREADRRKYALGVKHFSFQEMVDAARTGHSLWRIGGEGAATRFLWVDLDNEYGENVTSADLDQFVTETFAYTPGASGKPYKWHIFVLLDNAISSHQDFKEQTERVKKMIEDRLERTISVDDALETFLHALYGCPQQTLDHHEFRPLPGTDFYASQITKSNSFQVNRIAVPYNPDEDCRRLLLPYNSAMLLNLLESGGFRGLRDDNNRYIHPELYLEGKRFDITPPYRNRTDGKKIRIKEGHRYNTARKWIYCLVPMLFRCHYLGLTHYRYEDMEYTLRFLCRSYMENANSWWTEDGSCLMDLMHNLFMSVNGAASSPGEGIHEVRLTDYSAIEANFEPTSDKNVYLRRGYARAAVAIYCNEHNEDGFVRFDDRNAIRLAVRFVAESTFRNNMPEGFSIKLKSRKTRTDAGISRKYPDLRSRCCGNTYYCAKGCITPAIRKACSKQGISVVTSPRVVPYPATE